MICRIIFIEVVVFLVLIGIVTAVTVVAFNNHTQFNVSDASQLDVINAMYVYTMNFFKPEDCIGNGGSKIQNLRKDLINPSNKFLKILKT